MKPAGSRVAEMCDHLGDCVEALCGNERARAEIEALMEREAREPEPSYEEQMRDAGRGHLLG